MTPRRLAAIALAAIALLACIPSAQAEIRVLQIEALMEPEAVMICRSLADQEGGDWIGEIRNIDYFLWECPVDIPAQRNVSVEVMPLLHEAQARLVCGDAAAARDGRWTGDWDNNGPLSPGACTIRVAAD